MLHGILDRGELELKAALSQLVDAELLYRIRIGKDAGYKFKHALIQDAAYESMLKSQRRQLHQRIAQVLEGQFKEIATAQPELLAYHNTKAGLYLSAIPIWLKAGQSAIQKHAIPETIAHLEEGLQLLEHIKDEQERNSVKLDFLLTLGSANGMIYGITHEKVGEILNQAKTIAQKVKVDSKLAFILFNLMPYYCLSEKYELLEELIDYTLQYGDHKKDGYLFRVFGKMPLGVSSIQRGRFIIAANVLQEIVDQHDPTVYMPIELIPSGEL